MALTTKEVIVSLLDFRGTAVVEAVTPHGTYTFNVVSVEGFGYEGPRLNLVEVEKSEHDNWHSIMGMTQ